MEKLLAWLVSVHKTPLVVLIAVAGACAVLAFGDAPLHQAIGAEKWMAEYGGWVAVVLVLSSVFAAVLLAIPAVDWIRRRLSQEWGHMARSAQMLDALENLSPDERAVLRHFVFFDEVGLLLPPTHRAVDRLIHMGMLQSMPTTRRYVGVKPFRVTLEWEQAITMKHRGFSCSDPSSVEMETAYRERPDFLRAVAPP